MSRINVNDLRWKVATKTKNVRAKPLISIMVDRSVLSKFLIDTLEGKEPLGDGAVVCLGESNDVWQQMPKKLLQKYNVVEIDNDGWMVCEPRPDNAVLCHQVGPCDIEPIYYPDASGALLQPWLSDKWKDREFYIIGQWGEDSTEGPKQFGKIGDYICQNRDDPTDVWIVRRKIFINTYTIKE